MPRSRSSFRNAPAEACRGLEDGQAFLYDETIMIAFKNLKEIMSITLHGNAA